MCKCRGKKGDQGDTGPAGATFTINSVVVSTGTIGALTTKTIIASSPTTGTLKFWGHISMADTAKNSVTLRPVIGGVTYTAGNGEATLDTKACINVTGSVAITAGDAFNLTITMSAYSGNATVEAGVIHYSIV